MQKYIIALFALLITTSCYSQVYFRLSSTATSNAGPEFVTSEILNITLEMKDNWPRFARGGISSSPQSSFRVITWNEHSLSDAEVIRSIVGNHISGVYNRPSIREESPNINVIYREKTMGDIEIEFQIRGDSLSDSNMGIFLKGRRVTSISLLVTVSGIDIDRVYSRSAPADPVMHFHGRSGLFRIANGNLKSGILVFASRDILDVGDTKSFAINELEIYVPNNLEPRISILSHPVAGLLVDFYPNLWSSSNLVDWVPTAETISPFVFEAPTGRIFFQSRTP